MSPLPALRACGVLALISGLALSQAAFSQPVPSTPPPAASEVREVNADLQPFQGRPVRGVRFRVPAAGAGSREGDLPAEEDLLARNQLRQTVGVPFDALIVTQDVSRLNRLGRFRRVEANVQLLADGSVDLVYFVTLQPLITAVQTVGNRAFDDDELVGDLRLEGTPVDPTLLERVSRRIEDQYRAKGYYNALVSVDEAELEDSGIVVFSVREGIKTRVSEVRFEGAKSFLPGQLKKAVKTKEAWIIDFFRDTAGVDNDKLDEDVGSLIGFYKDRGYLDVRADRTVTPSPDGKEAIVTFIVDEGPVYTVRDVQMRMGEGETPVISLEQMQGLLRVKSGDVYSEGELRESIKAVAAAYGTLGYADATVNRQLLREPGESRVDIRLVVRQGVQSRTGMVLLRGNTETRSEVIREQITLEPERPLDPGEIEVSRKRIERLRLFAPSSVKSSILPEREDEPGYRDVLFEVTEQRNRSFNFGAGVSSDASVTGRIAVTQRNFDITDWPDTWSELWSGEGFYGGGQNFTIEAVPGNRVRIFSISLSDPYAFGTDYSLSGSAYYRDRLYRAYTEQRIGAKVAAGRRFGSRWAVSFPLTIEQVELSDIDADAPTEYFDFQEGNALLSAGIQFSRSDVDDVTFPSKGSNIELGLTQYTGDFTFAKIGAEYSRYFKLDEDALNQKTVLQLTSRVGYIPQGQEDVPFYERYYMGGQTFRGFGFRAVAPIGIRNDTGGVADDTVGGIFSFFAGAEIRRPLLSELVSGVLFIDTGTVDDEIDVSAYRVSVGFGFRIYIQQLSNAPLAFDFGFPILKEDTDETRLFTFTIDLPFN